MDYGDLYRETKLRPFKIRVPERVGPEMEESDSATIVRYPVVLMGDSFIAAHRGFEDFSRGLARSLGAPVFIATWRLGNPACLFRGLRASAGSGGPRLVILETTELSLISRLAKVPDCPTERSAPLTWQKSLSDKLYDRLFADAEGRHRFVVYNSVLTAPVIEAWNTLLFSAFGVIPASVAKYSLNPPLLFSKAETSPELPSSYHYPHPDSLVRAIADQVAGIRDQLEREQHARFIFIPIPGKYTLYHRFAGTTAYDEFLPRLYAELDRRGVETVKLYDPFLRFPGIVYLPADSHWNANGARIALEETLRVIGSKR